MYRLSNKFHKKLISATGLLSIMTILSLSCSSSGQEVLTVGNAKAVMVSRLAGSANEQKGNIDGAAEAARFKDPMGIAVDSTGNVYIADSSNDVIRKITPAGVVSTLAGTAGVTGSTNGKGATARFNQPQGIAIDKAGNIYVADSRNDLIRKITSAGVVSTLAGTAGLKKNSATDGKGSAAHFNMPQGIAIDSADNLYIADSGNYIIRKITPDGMVSTLAGTAHEWDSVNGKGAASRFSGLNGIAVDGGGNIYITEEGIINTVRKITPDGMVSTFAGAKNEEGSTDGAGTKAHFNLPIGLATDSAGNVYVADADNDTIRKITPAGVVSTLAGAVRKCGTTNGEGAMARFCNPSGVATDKAGNVYIADTLGYSIRKITPK